MVHKLGYGAWDELKAEIRRSWRFRFDWFFKSRMPQVSSCSTLHIITFHHLGLSVKGPQSEEG